MKAIDTRWAWAEESDSAPQGPHESREAALVEARDYYEPGTVILVGQVEYMRPADYVSVSPEDVTKKAAKAAGGDGWQVADVYLRVRADTGTDAREQLGDVLAAWAHEWLSSTDWRLAWTAEEVTL